MRLTLSTTLSGFTARTGSRLGMDCSPIKESRTGAASTYLSLHLFEVSVSHGRLATCTDSRQRITKPSLHSIPAASSVPIEPLSSTLAFEAVTMRNVKSQEKVAAGELMLRAILAFGFCVLLVCPCIFTSSNASTPETHTRTAQHWDLAIDLRSIAHTIHGPPDPGNRPPPPIERVVV